MSLGGLGLSVSASLGSTATGAVGSPSLVNNVNSLLLDGSNDYVDLNSDHEAWLERAQKTFTCWIKNDGNTSEGRVFNVGYDDSGRKTGFAFGIDGGTTDNKPFVFLRDTSAATVKVEFGDVCDTTSWYHFAVVQDGANDKAYCYQNGVLKATFHSTEDAPFNVDIGEVSQATNHSAKIGKHWNPSDSNYYDGHIDEIGLWNKSLTADEILYIYNQASAGKVLDLSVDSLDYVSSSDLHAWWRCYDAQIFINGDEVSPYHYQGSTLFMDHANLSVGTTEQWAAGGFTALALGTSVLNDAGDAYSNYNAWRTSWFDEVVVVDDATDGKYVKFKGDGSSLGRGIVTNNAISDGDFTVQEWKYRANYNVDNMGGNGYTTDALDDMPKTTDSDGDAISSGDEFHTFKWYWEHNNAYMFDFRIGNNANPTPADAELHYKEMTMYDVSNSFHGHLKNGNVNSIRRNENMGN